METKSEMVTADNGAQVELATISFQGREFTNLGSVIDHSNGRIAGYVKGDALTSWDGQIIGSVRVISSRPAVFFGHRSWIGDRLYYYRATVDGKAYHGCGFGDGMLLKLRANK